MTSRYQVSYRQFMEDFGKVRKASRIVRTLDDNACRVALIAILTGKSLLQALLIGQSYRVSKDTNQGIRL